MSNTNSNNMLKNKIFKRENYADPAEDYSNKDSTKKPNFDDDEHWNKVIDWVKKIEQRDAEEIQQRRKIKRSSKKK
jgi:hypothetical protein